VLERMEEEGYITKEQKQAALAEKIQVSKERRNPFYKAPYFTEYVRQYLEQKYGHDLLYRGGLKVYTTVNIDMQREGGAQSLYNRKH